MVAKKATAVTTGGFLDAVKGISAPKEPASKKDKLQTIVPTKELQATVDEVVALKKTLKETKAELEGREAEVIEFCKNYQDEEGFNGNFQKSYRVQGETEIVTFVSSDKFSAFDPADVEPLKEALGKRFSEFVAEKIQVTVKEEVFENESLQNELTEVFKNAYGESWQEHFGKFFRAEQKIVATKDFDKRIYALGRKIVEKIRPYVKQAKPSIK